MAKILFWMGIASAKKKRSIDKTTVAEQETSLLTRRPKKSRVKYILATIEVSKGDLETTYLPLGGLLPLPPPDGFPVVDGPLGGRGVLAVAIFYLLNLVFMLLEFLCFCITN